MDEDVWDDEPGDDEEVSADESLETEVSATCPHCGAPVSLALDPAGGRVQEYIQDCEVCCRPWRVEVNYDGRGAADVQLEGLE